MIRRILFGVILAGVLGAGSLSAQVSGEWQDVIRNLRHPNPATRLDAVERLARAGYYAAAEAVAPLIADPDDRVQAAAIDAQLRFFQSDRIDGSKSAAQAAFEAGPLLRGAAPVPLTVLDALLVAVRDEHPRVQFDAIHAFGFLADAPISDDLTRRLVAELDHYDPTIRAATARVIGRLRVAGAADALLTALGDSSPVVRQYAVESLGILKETRAAAPIRERIASARGNDAIIRGGALALARLGLREDGEFLGARMTDRDAVLRRAAVEWRGRIGDTESIPYLQGLLQTDRSYPVRAAAAFALQLLGQPQSHGIAPLLVIRDVNAQARDYLFEIGPPAVPGLISTLRVATDGRHRADLVQLIGYLGTRDDIAVLEPLAADRDERVRRAVATATARLQR